MRLLRTSAAVAGADSVPGSAIQAGAVTLSKTGTDIWTKGADIASGNNLAPGADGDLFHVTGTTQVNLIASTNFRAGSHIRLIFDGALTVKHGQTTSGANKRVNLFGASDIKTVANDTMEFVYDGTTWNQIGIGDLATLGTQISRVAGLRRSGSVAEFFDAQQQMANNITALASGSEYSQAVYLFAGEVVTSITFMSGGTLWSGATDPHRYFLLRDSSGAQLAISADDGANAWAANAEKTLAMTVAYVVPTSGIYYFCVNHEFGSGASNTFSGIGVAGSPASLVGPPIRWGLTTGAVVAGAVTTPLTITSGGRGLWGYFS